MIPPRSPPRCPTRDSRWMVGRSTRSKNGCWSSISSNDLGWTMSWLSRCWTASCGGPAAMPYVMSRTAIAALTAMRISGVMASHLDVDDAADEHVADPHADQADDEEDDAERQSQRLRRTLHHRDDVGRADEEQDGGESDRQQGD